MVVFLEKRKNIVTQIRKEIVKGFIFKPRKIIRVGSYNEQRNAPLKNIIKDGL